MAETFLTQKGYDKLKEELEYLKTQKRVEIAENIKIARGFGDLKENDEYKTAKNEQAEVETRIKIIEEQLQDCVIIEEKTTGSEISIGSTVKVLDIEYNEEMTFTIVGTVEANPKKQKISNESPLGKSLLGKKNGEIVIVEANGKRIEYKVLEIVK